MVRVVLACVLLMLGLAGTASAVAQPYGSPRRHYYRRYHHRPYYRHYHRRPYYRHP